MAAVLHIVSSGVIQASLKSPAAAAAARRRAQCSQQQNQTKASLSPAAAAGGRRGGGAQGRGRTQALLRVHSKKNPKSAASPNDDATTVVLPESKLMFPYPEAAADVSVDTFESSAELAAALAQFIAQKSREAIEARGVFSIAISGGSLVSLLKGLLSEELRGSVEWGEWHVLWVDERVVPLTSPESNFKLANDEVLSKLPIPEDQVYFIDDSLPLQECADEYEEVLRELVEDNIVSTTNGSVFPRLDLILLGFGPDGHVASLFPNSPLLRATPRWVLPVSNSPKPPPKRITFSLPVINSARQIAFVASGKGKANVVQRILERPALPGSLPAQLVQPYNGSIGWFLDVDAASELSTSRWGDAKSFPFYEKPK